MDIRQFNGLSQADAIQNLLGCCTAQNWAIALCNKRPFASKAALITEAKAVWQTMCEADLLEAFEGHPKIGDVSSLKAKYRYTQSAAAHEQSGADDAPDAVLNELAQLNADYEAKFGFIFIVFASGKTAEQMLAILKSRIDNSRVQELANASVVQAKILVTRLDKLIED